MVVIFNLSGATIFTVFTILRTLRNITEILKVFYYIYVQTYYFWICMGFYVLSILVIHYLDDLQHWSITFDFSFKGNVLYTYI